MKFHLVAGVLVCITGYLVYILLFGLHSDLENAHATIQKESVQSLKGENKIQKENHFAPYINKNLISEHPKPVRQVADASVSNRAEQPSQNQAAEERISEDKDYWCRAVPLTIETNPVKCLYPNACYGCEGPIIRPEYEDAIPLCANGRQSQLYNVECCPSFVNGAVQCQTAEECFQADSVSSEACTCNNRPECRIAQIGTKIQCACIEN